MDPLSQGVLGAVAALSLARPRETRVAALSGWAAGMLADADVFIRSSSDPLLNIEYHRHFTHALAFIPVGGFLAAAVLWLVLRRYLAFPRLLLYCLAGYATAGLLDACTSYGTQLYWPFSDLRVAWNLISIIDPLFTLPLLVLVVLAATRRGPSYGRFALAYAVLYLGFGLLQRERAAAFQEQLALQRGHQGFQEATVKPSIANLLLWRSIYRHDDRYYVDAVRVGVFQPNIAYPGDSLPAFDLEKALASLPNDSVLAHDLRRFNHFSEGYLAALPDEPNFITDLRYSALPDAIAPLWGIDIDVPDPSQHVDFETRRDIDRNDRRRLLDMLAGAPPDSLQKSVNLDENRQKP